MYSLVKRKFAEQAFGLKEPDNGLKISEPNNIRIEKSEFFLTSVSYIFFQVNNFNCNVIYKNK